MKSRRKMNGALYSIRPRFRGAVRKDIQHQFRLHARLRAQHDSFVERLQDIRENQVLRQLGVQPHARPAAIVQLLAHRFEKRLRFFEDLLVAADHEGKGAVGRARRRTGARRAQEIDPGLRQFLVDPHAGRRADRAGIHHHQSLLAAFFNPVRAQDDRLGHLRVADAQEDHLGIARDFGRRGARLRPAFRRQLLRLCRRVRPDARLRVRLSEGCGPWDSPSVRVQEIQVLP